MGRRRVRLSLAGPVAFVTVIATWAWLLVLGWALVFWPHVPGSFRFDAGIDAGGSDFVHALNVSLVTLTTLGFGDITPTSDTLRLILPLEALLGFGLLSASISWLISIYPALSRRRSLAYEISLLRVAEAEDDLSLDALTPDVAERLLAELTSRLVAVERDLVHFPISYYFSAADPRFSLPVAAPYLLEIARRGMNEAQPMTVRFRSRLLMQAIDDLAKTTAERFHGSGATTRRNCCASTLATISSTSADAVNLHEDRLRRNDQRTSRASALTTSSRCRPSVRARFTTRAR